MRMIPPQPLSASTSHAELKVFDQLRSAFSAADRNAWFAMHSLNLPRHEYKRFGEIDFVVCGPQGLFVLEVKGGGLSCHNGIWTTRDRYGETNPLKESPFKQAESALHGLISKLSGKLPGSFAVGYGVVMPDVRSTSLPESAEWERAVLADSRDCRQFEQWLQRLIRHWRAKSNRQTSASHEELQAIQQCLRPDFEAVAQLHGSSHDVELRIAKLTMDQLKFIDVAENNPRVLCSGGAGTGKTMLALELAKRWGAAGMQTALVCHSPWLRHFLERSAMPGLTVSLADSIHIAAKRAGIEQFHALIVDEGQDILHMAALDRLDRCLSGGISAGRWCFFHDANNQSGLCGSYEPEACEYLQSFNPTRIPLTMNCRNSLQILEQIQDTLDADMGNAGVGDGPAVRTVNVTDAEAAIRAVEQQLQELLDEGFHPGDIVILSPVPFAQSCMAALSGELRESISVLDDASPRNLHRHHIGFARIGDFKGLESAAVVLVDLPAPGQDEDLRALHYVGMSRARVLLSMVCCRAPVHG